MPLSRPVCYALANGESLTSPFSGSVLTRLELAQHLLLEAGNHRERQLKMAKEHRLEVIEHCEEFMGTEEAEQLRTAFATGFLAGGQARNRKGRFCAVQV